MTEDNSKTTKDPNYEILSSVVDPIKNPFNKSQGSGLPSSSERNSGQLMKNLRWKLFSKATTTSPGRSTLPHPPTSSTNRTDGDMPPELSLSTDQQDSQPSKNAPSTASASRLHGHASSSDKTEGNLQSPQPNAESSMKENLKLTGRALQTLVTKAANTFDNNPAKVALGLVKAIIEIHKIVKDNKDAVAQQIASTGSRLEAVEEALRGWKPDNKEGNPWMDHFTVTVKNELQKLQDLSDGSNLKKIVDHEDIQKRIKDIFVNVNEARIDFELALGVRVFRKVHEVDQAVKELFFDRLKPSYIAHHDYLLEGEEGQSVQRQVCTPGTRIRILDSIITWAKDTSSNSPTVYWLFGHAGSGKTSIGYTIARHFEFAGDSSDTVILGGNFFCSRQFEQTRQSKYITRTIVYHLALKCEPFAGALRQSGRLDTITQSLYTQLDGLLVGPWKDSKAGEISTLPHYLVVIDAVDELDGTGGSDFLRALLKVINKQDLPRLKFFITSRSDPALVDDVDKFEHKHRYRLQDVDEVEVTADIKMYLHVSLPNLATNDVDKLVTSAAGLFIYAATVVKALASWGRSEQEQFLAELSAASDSSDSVIPKPASDATSFTLLDKLYLQVLRKAFYKFTPKSTKWSDRLKILHTFLSTLERTSISVVGRILFSSDYTDVAENLLSDLHAVLYTEHDRVLAYHKSFSDFLFDEQRSAEFWCDPATHHQLLTDCCFRVMKAGLRFNIANIPSSFIHDCDNHALVGEVERNIPPVLSYSCRNWDHHLSATNPITSKPLHVTLSEFLELRALFWIEAMNLLHLRGRCPLMLQTAQKWVFESEGNSSLTAGLTEAGSFAFYFSGSGAWLSTPHLYISTLATWPRKSNPIQGWKKHFTEIPQFTNASTGGTVLMTIKTDNPVNGVAFSSNGSYIVGGLSDNSVRVWDALTGEEKLTLNGHTNSVTSVALSREGSRIVSGSHDNSVRVWDALTGEEKFTLNGHTDWVMSVAFSRDASHIVSGSYDDSVRVWDALTAEEKATLNGHTNRVTSVAFSGDASRIVSGSYDKSVRVWDALTGKEKLKLNGHTESVNSVAFSRDASRIVCGSHDKSVRVWDALTGEEKLTLYGHTGPVMSVALSEDDNHVVSGSDDKSVRVWEILMGEATHKLDGNPELQNPIAFSTNASHTVVRYTRETTPFNSPSTIHISAFQNYTGWLLSPHGEGYLMFVPPAANLPDDANTLTIPHYLASHVDFTNSRLGSEWINVFL